MIEKYLARVAGYGCLACRSEADNWKVDMPPASLHHIQEVKGQRLLWAVIGLCPQHHTGDAALSLHNNKTNFRSRHGHEWYLYFKMRKGLIMAGKWPFHYDKFILDRLNRKDKAIPSQPLLLAAASSGDFVYDEASKEWKHYGWKGMEEQDALDKRQAEREEYLISLDGPEA